MAATCGIISAQDPPPSSGTARALPRGILTTIPPAAEEGETFTRGKPIVELLANPDLPEWKPNFTYKPQDGKVHKAATLKELAEKAVFRRNIWCLEFSFKPLRMIEVDIPQANGRMQRKQLWYMVYRVKNNGYHLGVKPEKDDWDHETYAVERINQNVHCFPHFVMQLNIAESQNGATTYTKKEYLDRVIPAAMKPIADRERVGVKLHDSVSISRAAIPVSDERVDRSLWGVAIWEDLDLRVDYFSVFVQGLTNAYQFEDPQGAYKAGDPPGTGRQFTTKTLQLNFWRPGDALLAHEDEIRYGVPVESDPLHQQEIFDVYGVPGPLDHQWVFR